MGREGGDGYYGYYMAHAHVLYGCYMGMLMSNAFMGGGLSGVGHQKLLMNKGVVLGTCTFFQGVPNLSSQDCELVKEQRGNGIKGTMICACAHNIRHCLFTAVFLHLVVTAQASTPNYLVLTFFHLSM